MRDRAEKNHIHETNKKQVSSIVNEGCECGEREREERRMYRAVVHVMSRPLESPSVKRVMMDERGVSKGCVVDTRAYKCHIAAVIFMSGPVVVTLAFLSLLCYAKEGR